MTQALSLYLDMLRFAAAFTVFLSHYAAGRHSGGLFWQVGPYGRVAVLVFFVLSGFVIAFVSETRERTLEEYCLSRFAQLYSVILPAFIATAALDGLAVVLNPGSNLGSGQDWLHPVSDYLLSALFLGANWTLSVQPGSNVPFWSLNYEAWYYGLFAAAVFLQGRGRVLALAVAAMVAGPKILVLLPVWLMGVTAWRWRTTVPSPWSMPLVFGAAAGLTALGAGQHIFWQAATPWLPPFYSAFDYFIGALAAVAIAAMANAPLPLPGPAVQRLIRTLAGTAFELYLLHYPLLHFFSTVIPGAPPGAAHRLPYSDWHLADRLCSLTRLSDAKLRLSLRLGLDLVRRRCTVRQSSVEGSPEPIFHEANCSFNTRSSRLNSRSKSRVIAISRFS
jgi:peptidoglycan/LPS O-acetylase OafA/YrhL